MKVACVGPRRDVPHDIEVLMRNIGGYLVENGHKVASGNADGSDRFYAEGANEIDPSRVTLYLPWYKFNREFIHPHNKVVVAESNELLNNWTGIASHLHPAWTKLSKGVRLLMARNVGIIQGSSQMIYWRDECMPKRGGTYFDTVVAECFEIEMLNLWRDEDRQRVEKKVLSEES